MFALLRDSNLLQKKKRTLRSLDKNNKINRQEKESTTKEVTLMNSPGGEVFLGIRRGGVPPGSPNPGPISGPKSCFFPHPFPDLASKIYTRSHTWRRQKLCYHY